MLLLLPQPQLVSRSSIRIRGCGAAVRVLAGCAEAELSLPLSPCVLLLAVADSQLASLYCRFVDDKNRNDEDGQVATTSEAKRGGVAGVGVVKPVRNQQH